MYTEPKVTIDLEEYMQLKKTIENLSRPPEGTELSEAEQQEATGLLLVRALDNPQLFRSGTPDIQLGKFTAIFAMPALDTSAIRPTVRVKFVRT